MKPKQIIEESKKYLSYISDALHGAAQSPSLGKAEREVFEKYSADMIEYAKGLEKLKLHLTAQEETAKRIQIKAELEERHAHHKKVLVIAEKNLKTIKEHFAEVKKSGSEKEIAEAQLKVDYYTKQHAIAAQNEFIAKRDFERGA